MFSSVFQGGELVEVFDAKINPKKEKRYKNLYKVTNKKQCKRVFDKVTKGYVFEMNQGIKNKLQFPRLDKKDLGLI